MTQATEPLSSFEIRQAASLARAVYGVKSDWLIKVDPQVHATFLAIEGSDDLIDWRRNFEFLMTSQDTHAGFQNYGTLLMAQMLAGGVSFNANRRLILCGHSLGGAVATVIAAQLQDHIPDLHLVTFGSPRPGGKRFARRLRVPHHRFVHGKDVVPHLPSTLLGFRHTVPPNPLPIPDDSLLLGIQDHAMDGYILALPSAS